MPGMSKPARPPLSWQRYDDVLLLAGAIDERAQLAELVVQARNGRLALDCAGVTFINSLGLRAWIALQAAATAANIAVELLRVAEPIVHQLNLVVAARGTARVTSFLAPYVCDHCDVEKHVQLDVATHGDDLARGVLPTHACPSCSRPMSFAHPPELYLQFLRR
jgi:anti-anti-sigma regulatory factor